MSDGVTRLVPDGPGPGGMSDGLPTTVTDGSARYDLVRAWPRGRDHVLLELCSESGESVAGQWFADRDALTEAARTAPENAVVAGDVLLQPGGADARLPHLRAVLAEPGARLVAHRPGRRAVVALPGGDGRPRAFAKVVRPGRAPDLARRGELVAELLTAAVPVPRLLDGSDVGRGVLLWSVVPGQTLHDLGSREDWTPDRAYDAWHAAGRATVGLHDADQQAVAARHSAEDELDAIAGWLDPAVAHGLLDRDLVGRAGDHVTAALTGSGPGATGVLHRDLHDKQLLLGEDGSVGMIDVDTLAVGERALDVANVLVHLELREAQGLLAPASAAASRAGLLAGVGMGNGANGAGLLAGAGADECERLAAYADATRLRLAGVYAFRPRWHAVATDLLSRVAHPA